MLKETVMVTLRNDSYVEDFVAQGYVILRGLLDPEVVQLARRAMMQLVDQEARKLIGSGLIDDARVDAPFDRRLYLLYREHLDRAPLSFRKELHLPELYPLFFNPELLDRVEELLGPEIRLYPNYTARPKLPAFAGTEVLWHQDGGYTEQIVGGRDGLADLRMVNVWTPLVPATRENGCMQFIPGTHRLGPVEHVQKTEIYLEIAREFLDPLLDQVVDIELDPGDVVLFHNLLFHQGQPNRSDHIRWSLDWRYQDATQPTLRVKQGYLARSRQRPESVVRNAEHWGRLEY
ncbi:MAG TPA: phytanoyl-CoA dioxygenase family protein [Candidatus Sumerlaeota bacterium]|nr:phytanoyl-CoA dioxygenase family protein [Candidatus Sumerlaeota bacterium]HOR26530.1 phytanoyl-CoA dioxygenase family protein [Candidatus Sumerlaeota bacterium]